MEDGGSSGSAGSHWEKTFIGDEVMQAYKGNNMFLTTMTAKFLEDSGFYLINYDYVTPFTFGKDLGCDFIQNSSNCDS